jgi:hypothetical protein
MIYLGTSQLLDIQNASTTITGHDLILAPHLLHLAAGDSHATDAAQPAFEASDSLAAFLVPDTLVELHISGRDRLSDTLTLLTMGLDIHF